MRESSGRIPDRSIARDDYRLSLEWHKQTTAASFFKPEDGVAEEPHSKVIKEVRKIRDEIGERGARLITEIIPGGTIEKS